MFFFVCGVWGSNLRPYIYYALSLPTELNSRGQITCSNNSDLNIVCCEVILATKKHKRLILYCFTIPIKY